MPRSVASVSPRSGSGRCPATTYTTVVFLAPFLVTMSVVNIPFTSNGFLEPHALRLQSEASILPMTGSYSSGGIRVYLLPVSLNKVTLFPPSLRRTHLSWSAVGWTLFTLPMNLLGNWRAPGLIPGHLSTLLTGRLSSSSLSEGSVSSRFSSTLLVVDFFVSGQAAAPEKCPDPSHVKQSFPLAGHLPSSCWVRQLLHLTALSLLPSLSLNLTLYFPLFLSFMTDRAEIFLSNSSSDMSSMSLSPVNRSSTLGTLLSVVTALPAMASAVALLVSLVEPTLMRVCRLYFSASAFSARDLSFMPDNAATLMASSLVKFFVSSWQRSAESSSSLIKAIQVSSCCLIWSRSMMDRSLFTCLRISALVLLITSA